MTPVIATDGRLPGVEARYESIARRGPCASPFTGIKLDEQTRASSSYGRWENHRLGRRLTLTTASARMRARSASGVHHARKGWADVTNVAQAAGPNQQRRAANHALHAPSATAFSVILRAGQTGNLLLPLKGRAHRRFAILRRRPCRDTAVRMLPSLFVGTDTARWRTNERS